MNRSNEIKLVDYIELIINKIIFLTIFTLFTLIFVSVYAFFCVPSKYISSGSIMIQVESTQGQTNTIESQRLVKSTVDILTGMNLIPEETSKSLKLQGYNISKNEIRSNLIVSSSNNSLIITIDYISTIKEETKIVVDELINTLIRVTNDEQYNMDKTLKNNISKLYVSDVRYYSPNKPLIIFIGGIIGFIIAVAMIFINEMINSGYKEKDEIEEELNIQVLGAIPNFEVKRGNE